MPDAEGDELSDLPDSAFAFVEPGGHKDASGRTTPRRLRHYPVHTVGHLAESLQKVRAGERFAAQAAPRVLEAAHALLVVQPWQSSVPLDATYKFTTPI